MKENIRALVIATGFIIFLIVELGLSDYLTKIVPIPQTQSIDLYSAVHAFAAGGAAFFILIFTSNNARLRNYLLFALLALIFVWEIIENTTLRETALAGQESLENIGMDILIGVLSAGIVLSAQSGLFFPKPEKNICASKQINHKEP